MKKGQIIRRKHQNTGIGPYLIIELIEEDRVYASVIGLDTPNIMLLKKDVYCPTHAALPISEEALERMKKGQMDIIQHPATKLWEAVFEKCPELITFYSRKWKATFECMRVVKVYYGREALIRIAVEKMVI